MKKGIITIVLILAAGFLTLQAQQTKFAHINTQELFDKLPESDSAQSKIQAAAAEWQETIEEMQVELNQKYQAYMQEAETMTAIKRQTKEAELQEINTRIQSTSQMADKDLQALREKLLTPIIEKATKAIEEVGREDGYTYIFDTSEGSVVIFQADNAVDIMDKVLKKLGVSK